MAEPLDIAPFNNAEGGQIREALDRLEELIVEGLKHGFFEYTVACQVVTGGNRKLVIPAGKSHQFTIPKSEVPR